MGLLGGGYAKAASDTALREEQIAIGAGLAASGQALGAGGAALKADAAGTRYDRLSGVTGKWLPTPALNQASYFNDLNNYFASAQSLSDRSAQAQQNQALNLREQAIPGLNAGIRGASQGVFDLMQGKLPDSVLANFQRAGGASTVGGGFGGSGYGFLNTGLFGARGSIGAMQTGYGLLGALMNTLPQISVPGAASWLTRGVMTPNELTGVQTGTRQQNIGIESTLAGMPLSGDIWGDYLGGMGSTAYGAGLAALTGMAVNTGRSPYGQYGGYAPPQSAPGQSPYYNPTSGSTGNNGYYDTPVNYGDYGDHNA